VSPVLELHWFERRRRGFKWPQLDKLCALPIAPARLQGAEKSSNITGFTCPLDQVTMKSAFFATSNTRK
jgi:hypothetical protein